MSEVLVSHPLTALSAPGDPGVATPRVSVVICCYTPHRWAQLAAAVASLQEQTLPPHEVVLVVDHCPELATRARTDLPGRTCPDGPARTHGDRQRRAAGSVGRSQHRDTGSGRGRRGFPGRRRCRP